MTRHYTIKSTIRLEIYDDNYDLEMIKHIFDEALTDASCSTPGFISYDYKIHILQTPHWLSPDRSNAP